MKIALILRRHSFINYGLEKWKYSEEIKSFKCDICEVIMLI